jgi:hypothetical protein
VESLFNVLAKILVYSPIRCNDLKVHGTDAFYDRIGHGKQANGPCLRRGMNRAPVARGTTEEANGCASAQAWRLSPVGQLADRSAELSMAIPLVNAVLEVVGFYGQDAARGVTDNSLRHRSHQKGPQAGSSVGAHNHQVRLMLAGELDDS